MPLLHRGLPHPRSRSIPLIRPREGLFGLREWADDEELAELVAGHEDALPTVKRPRSPTRNGEKFGRRRPGSSSDSDFKAFKDQAIRRKGKGIKGAHDSDSEDSEFPAVAMNLHRAGFSVHQGGGGGGGGGGARRSWASTPRPSS